jgi:histidinol-phosphate/aromatic aminotransferase/cobyric acid decarboxylase-like protein
MTMLILRFFGLYKPKNDDFLGLSSGEKKRIFSKAAQEANQEQLALVKRYPERFEELKKKLGTKNR